MPAGLVLGDNLFGMFLELEAGIVLVLVVLAHVDCSRFDWTCGSTLERRISAQRTSCGRLE